MLHPKVVIFMGTYNGERYLAEQLNSICSQTHKNWTLSVSDDGSNDNTRNILQDYQHRLGENMLFIKSGPCKGFSANFLSLVCQNNINNIEGYYFAFSDQDDIWQPKKLQQAVKWLNTIPEEVPALYCARTRLINQDGTFIGRSPLFKKNPGFLNALIQSVGGGNTMVFNKTALNLLREAGENINIVAHDWWAYMVVSGAGGVVFYDPESTLLYRQHDKNLIGSNIGWRARLNRVLMLFNGRFKQWNEINFQALLSIKHLLTEENKAILMKIIAARNTGPISRMMTIQQLGLYRQTLLGNIGLKTAALFNKI
jgi:glycosyltransferase involved in cell wall biosynthesis